MQNKTWLFRVWYIGDYTTQLFGDYFINHFNGSLLRIPIINLNGMETKAGLFGPCLRWYRDRGLALRTWDLIRLPCMDVLWYIGMVL